jgi:hypothetical protein
MRQKPVAVIKMPTDPVNKRALKIFGREKKAEISMYIKCEFMGLTLCYNVYFNVRITFTILAICGSAGDDGRDSSWKVGECELLCGEL